MNALLLIRSTHATQIFQRFSAGTFILRFRWKHFFCGHCSLKAAQVQGRLAGGYVPWSSPGSHSLALLSFSFGGGLACNLDPRSRSLRLSRQAHTFWFCRSGFLPGSTGMASSVLLSHPVSPERELALSTPTRLAPQGFHFGCCLLVSPFWRYSGFGAYFPGA